MSYTLIPAALANSQETPVCIYVKYGQFPNEMKVLEQTTSMMRLQLPDRQIIITNDTDKDSGSKVFDWDECIPISPFHKTSNHFDFPDIAMINYVEHYGKMDKSNKSCRKGCIPNKTKIVCDSGGFQIAMGRVAYIDPRNLAKFYNENADMGVVLDIPLYQGLSDEVLLSAAKTQKKNTKILLDNIDDSVELINVCHGYSIDKYSKYLDVVTVPEVDRLCIAGLYLKGLLSGLSEFIHIVEKYKSHYKHFHLLGIYNVAFLSCYIYLAEKVFPDILVTSDASTPLQSARSGLYHFQREFNRPFERLTIGCIKNKLSYFNKNRLLPCSCPVCKAIKYMDVFSFLLSNPIIRSLTFHNIMEVTRAVSGVATIAHNSSFSDYREVMEDVLKTHVDKNEAKRGLDFIEVYLQDGLKKAEQMFKTQNYQGVFDTFTSGAICGDGQEQVSYTLETYKKRVNDIIKMYNTPGMVETFKVVKAVDEYRR